MCGYTAVPEDRRTCSVIKCVRIEHTKCVKKMIRVLCKRTLKRKINPNIVQFLLLLAFLLILLRLLFRTLAAFSEKQNYVTVHVCAISFTETNSCLAVLTHLSSWLTKHFLLVRQRSGITCLLTDVLQLVCTVLQRVC